MKEPFLTECGRLFAFVFIVGCSGYALWTLSQPGPEMIQAISHMNYKNGDIYENVKVLCTLKSFCEDWSKVRQDCSTAGDYRNCMVIKLGDAQNKFLDSRGGADGICKTDGTLDRTIQQPSKFLCFGNEVQGFKIEHTSLGNN